MDTIEDNLKIISKEDNKNEAAEEEEEEEHEKNKYLFREKCFVCKKLNPNPLEISSSSPSSSSSSSSSSLSSSTSSPNYSDCSDNETSRSRQQKHKKKKKNKEDIHKKNMFLKNNTFKKLTKLPLWMCKECKIKCKEEEDTKFIYEKVFFNISKTLLKFLLK